MGLGVTRGCVRFVGLSSLLVFGILSSTVLAATDADTLLTAGSRSWSVRDVQAWWLLNPRRAISVTVPSLPELKTQLRDHIAPRLQLAAYARAQLGGSPKLRLAVDGILSERLEASLRSEVTDAAVESYYTANAKDFATTEGLLLSRILVATEAEARALLAQLSAPSGLQKWSALTREHSTDTATKWRDGSLGFVRSDGSTDVPQVRVNPALFAAASKAPHGELVPEPVREGDAFAVVWRRGSRAAVTQQLAVAAPSIRTLLERQAAATQRAELLTRLRAAHVTELHPERLEETAYPEASGIPRAAVPLVPRGAANPEKPLPSDRGER